jgi:hypothetical protein
VTRRGGRRLASAALAASLSASTAFAQAPDLAVRTEATFYGDNTEFSNPFRSGETLFGAQARLTLVARLGDRVELTGGVFGNHRFGDEESFELVRPVLRVAIGTDRSRLVLGTLRTALGRDGPGPDRMGPHGLIPPLQVETLSFTRAHEVGLEWLVDTRRMRHDVWINWQKLNTPGHREVFDTGAIARVRVAGPLSAGFQFHLVHHGGQLFDSGPVSDSLGFGPGAIVEGRALGFDRATAEVYGLRSYHDRDRQVGRPIDGIGVFARAAGERGPWRAHLLAWRGCDFIKVEGDPNYLSIRQDGSRFRRVRDYAEAGATRTFTPADGVRVEASARFHRIESHYEYSYRLVAVIDLEFPLR